MRFMSSGRVFTYMHLSNTDMVEEMHAAFLEDPSSVDASWRYFFEGVEFGSYQKMHAASGQETSDLRIYQLIDAYRTYGHLGASVNPIAAKEIPDVPELTLAALGFTENELNQMFPTCGLLDKELASLTEIIEVLKQTYCGPIGIEYMSRYTKDLEKWLQKQIEPCRARPSFSVEEKQAILDYLNRSELFEIFLHTKYVGQKRFSLEGGETLIPILDAIIEQGSRLGMDEFVIGMPHRGRLNVLSNIMNKSYSAIFGEFEDYIDPHQIETAGDVKYHKGFSSDIMTRHGNPVHVSLAANPSHLESVDPVVEGTVHAKQRQRGDVEKKRVVPLLIHGDSSIAGQGVVYETLQFHALPGYSTGGTLHIVVNNQIGFTTLPREYRSSRYSTDIAHAFGFPVFHVNAEDPEGCIFATQLALQIRHLFHIDVFIELNCYRKYGHNESDEPAFTQPLEYQEIRKKKSIREIYRDHLIQEGVVEKEMALEMEKKFKEALHFELDELKLKKQQPGQEPFKGVWKDYKKASRSEILESPPTGVSLKTLQEIGKKLATIPAGFEVHSKLKRLIQNREKMIQGEISLDWAMAEQMAFASLLIEGYPVRLSGQDSQRGTFTQRHCVWVDQSKGERYFPLSNLQEDQGSFTAYNSSLAEFAVLGFEFGYSLAYPSSLVLWEAQFGDFANGGQVIFDQYISATEQKWSRYSGLVALLPHGYEGQGAEHSSARMERFLQMAAESNMQIVYPTTPAQYFHLLRRQALRLLRIPLIVFTPKGLLRHTECISSLQALSSGQFEEVLDDPTEPLDATRLILCAGRVYYDLLPKRAPGTAIIRIEQLYPLHQKKLKQILSKYSKVKKYLWVQEEPSNMGAFSYIEPLIHNLKVEYIGRPRSAATATGSHSKHEKELAKILEQAFEE